MSQSELPEKTFLPEEYNGDPKSSKKKMRNWWIKTILLLALVVLSVAMLFTLGNIITGEETPQLRFSELLRRINYPRLALLLGVILFYIVVESGKYAYMLKIYTGKFRFRIAVKTMFLGKYYDGITPFATGGQPFQMYYLHKKQIPRGVANAAPVLRYILCIFTLTALSVVLLAISPQFVEQNSITRTTLVISWVSIAINFLFPLIVVFFSLFPRFGERLVLGFIYLLNRLHIVKRKYGVSKKVLRELIDYSTVIKEFIHHFFKMLPLLGLSIIECLLYVTIPFFIVIAIGNVQPTLPLAIQIACLVVISRYTALLIPTPGTTGAMEAASMLVFSTVVGIGPVHGWVILTWRFLTYYMYILSGIGINIFEIIRSAVRNKRAVREGKF